MRSDSTEKRISKQGDSLEEITDQEKLLKMLNGELKKKEKKRIK